MCVCLYADKNNLACLTDSCIISCSMKCPAYYTAVCNIGGEAQERDGIVFISKTSCRDVHVVENYMLPSPVSWSHYAESRDFVRCIPTVTVVSIVSESCHNTSLWVLFYVCMWARCGSAAVSLTFTKEAEKKYASCTSPMIKRVICRSST